LVVEARKAIGRAGLIDANIPLAQAATTLAGRGAALADELAAAGAADEVRPAFERAAFLGSRAGGSVGFAWDAAAESALAVEVAALLVGGASKAVRLARAAATEVIDTRAGAAFLVTEADRAIRFADGWAAVAVGALAPAALFGIHAGAAVGGAGRTAAEAVLAHEGAALAMTSAGQSVGRALGAATEPTETIEVAALDRCLAGLAVRFADLLGFADLVLAQQAVAAIGGAFAALAQDPAGIDLDLVVLAGTGSTGGEGYKESKGGERTKGHPEED